MKSKRWVEITFSVPSSHQDLLVGPLVALGLEGFQQEDDSLKGFLPERRWTKVTRAALRHYLQNFQKEFPLCDLHFNSKIVPLQNWNARWERGAGIVEATPNIVIKPSWKKLRKRDRHKTVLHIDPKMSFGTGHHESTRLCLLLLESYVQPGMSILDFGSGTGVLAIAAVKLGCARAVAVDNDEWTIPNIRENLKRNRTGRKISVIFGDISAVAKGQFDMIVANVDLPTIAKVFPSLIRKLTVGGILILSGLLTTDLLSLHEQTFHTRMKPVNVIEENEWAAIALVKL